MGIFFSLSLCVCVRVFVLGIVVKLQQKKLKENTFYALRYRWYYSGI